MKQTLLQRRRQLWFLLAIAAFYWPAFSQADDLFSVTILDPFVDLHTGPGRGFPITHVVERGESIELLKRRTDWVLVRTVRGKEGWANRESLNLTLGEDGKLAEFIDPGLEDYIQRRWSGGFAAGDFSGAESLSGFLAYRFTNNLTVEGKITQAIGNFSDSLLGGISLQHEAFPEWRVSPFFALGVGVIKTSPDATLVQTEDRTDNVLMAGVGAHVYLSRRFMLRIEHTNHVILTSRNENDEVDEWKIGFTAFF